jgi:hypothetical protein
MLIDGGNSLNIVFSKMLESMGCDMTSLVPTKQAFYEKWLCPSTEPVASTSFLAK